MWDYIFWACALLGGAVILLMGWAITYDCFDQARIKRKAREALFDKVRGLEVKVKDLQSQISRNQNVAKNDCYQLQNQVAAFTAAKQEGEEMKPDKAKLAAKIEAMKVLNTDQKKEVRELVEELIGEKLVPAKPPAGLGQIWKVPESRAVYQIVKLIPGRYFVACLNGDGYWEYNETGRTLEQLTRSLSQQALEFAAPTLQDYLTNGGKL